MHVRHIIYLRHVFMLTVNVLIIPTYNRDFKQRQRERQNNTAVFSRRQNDLFHVVTEPQRG